MISHHHKCIFVHIPKNAGKSIEHVFLCLLGLTWKTRAPLLLRKNDQPELGPPNLAHLKWNEYVDCKYMTQNQFDEYFKFSFFRNPWSRAVSMYSYLRAHKHHERRSFKDFLMKDLQERLWNERHWFVGPQSEFVFDSQDRQRVDFVGRVECLQSDFDEVCKRIGLPPIEVPHRNASSTRGGDVSRKRATILPRWWRTAPPPHFSSFRDYYDDEGREMVAQLYERDIRLLGYTFGSTSTASTETAAGNPLPAGPTCAPQQ